MILGMKKMSAVKNVVTFTTKTIQKTVSLLVSNDPTIAASTTSARNSESMDDPTLIITLLFRCNPYLPTMGYAMSVLAAMIQLSNAAVMGWYPSSFWLAK